MGRFLLPRNHQPGLRVPKGGSSCANCKFYSPVGGMYGSCSSRYYQEWAGTALIPCEADSYCSDFYEPAVRLPRCR